MAKQKELTKADMSPDQIECFDLFADLVYGEHHMQGKVRECGKGLLWNARIHNLATYDFDGLTRLVIMAHERCIRVEIITSGPGLIGITAYKRHEREGEMWARHPTIDDAIKTYWERNPKAVSA